MAANPPLILRLLATSVKAVERAGRIIRDVRKSGNLGIVEKVCDFRCLTPYFFFNYFFRDRKLQEKVQYWLNSKLYELMINTFFVGEKRLSDVSRSIV